MKNSNSAQDASTSNAEFEQFISHAWEKVSEGSSSFGPLHTQADELASFSDQFQRNVQSEDFRVWSTFFDESLVWLFCVQQALFTLVFDDDGMPRDVRDPDGENVTLSRILCARWSIVSKLVSDLLAIRHLVARGLEGPARILARSSVEYIDLLIAVCHSDEIALEFFGTNDPENANRFFFKRISKGRLRRYVLRLLREKADEAYADVVKLLRDDGDEIQSIHSHPSMLSSFVVALIGPDEMPPNLRSLGGASESSLITVHYVGTHLSVIHMMCGELIPERSICESMCRGLYDEEMFERVALGRSVLLRMFEWMLNQELWVKVEQPNGVT